MQFLQHIFAFDTAHPLLFTQFYFWAFFAIVFAFFALIVSGRKASTRVRLHLRNIFLMFVSWFFYYKTSGVFLYILVTLTLVNWAIGLALSRFTRHSWRVVALLAAIVVNLGFLFYYKYAYFALDIFNSVTGLNYTIVDQIILPVGISFYTFQVISYVVDVYRREVAVVTNVFDFGFYVAFFPQLVAGPIVRASEFVPQLYKPFFLTKRQFGIAVFWILNGLLKKIILSDYLAVNFVDRVFQSPMLFTGFENFFALLVYSMQVYADFSGYTDIAIGVAMLMGFRLPQNFDAPYKARNPQEFWRRWHQSLSRWLKSYVYFPLGGNRTVFGRRISSNDKVNKLWVGNINRFATMLIGGLWHGASWNFVIWGALNGAAQIVNQIWRATNRHIRYWALTLITVAIVLWRVLGTNALPLVNVISVYLVIVWAGYSLGYLYALMFKPNGFSSFCGTVFAVLQTFVFISFTRLFFRAASNLDPATANAEAWSTAKAMVTQIGSAWDSSIIWPFMCEYKAVVMVFVLGMVVHWLPNRWKRWYRLNFAYLPIWAIALITLLAVFIAYQFVTADMQPFIYFQF